MAVTEQIRSLWRYFLAIFASQRRRNGAWSIEFVPTNLSELDAELQISKRAREQGAAGVPSIMDTQPDFVHRVIFTHFHQKLANLQADVQLLAQHYDAQFSQLGIERIPDRVRSAPDRFQQLVDSVQLRFRSQLDELRERRDNAKRDYKNFKDSYSRITDADYPKNKWAYYAAPFFILAVESAINSILFSGADPMGGGLSGGIKIALIIALINVVVAVIIGNGLRYLNAKELMRKLLGVICACAAALYVPLNLFWAHYRDRAIALRNVDAYTFDDLVRLRTQVLPDAWDKFWSHPLSVSSIESWGLFVFGIIVVAFALLDGYKMSDPIPGFEERDRALKRAQSALRELQDDCQRSIVNAFKTIAAELVQVERSFGGLLANYEAVLGAQRRLEAVYASQSRDYAESYATAVALCRNENLISRGGAPAPDYFNRPPEPLQLLPFPANVEVRLERQDELRAYADRISADVSAATVALQQIQAKALREIAVGAEGAANAG